MVYYRLPVLLLIFLLYGSIGFAFADSEPKSVTINYQKILDEAPQLSPNALRYALIAYQWVKIEQKIQNVRVLTIVDYSLPSNQKRLWVIDLTTNSILIHTYAAHGAKSGALYTTNFSNKDDSHESSFGAFKTLSSYEGSHGYSLRIAGLEPGINDNVYKRNIVIHSADYATYRFVREYNRLGRTFGCIAVDPAESDALISIIKNGSLIVVYPGDDMQADNLIYPFYT